MTAVSVAESSSASDVDDALRSTDSSIRSIEDTQKNVNAALSKVQAALGASADFEAKWAAFKSKVDEVLNASLENMRVAMTQGAAEPYKGELVLSEAEKCAILGGQATLETFARALSSKSKVVVLVGAGCSTSAGIPDFRSPGTGLYDNLQKYQLPTPQHLFSLEFLRENPKPFNEVAKELWPGRHSPTPAHRLIASLHKHGKLLRCYTQNIDGLERISGVPSESLVEAHGSFAAAHCIDCSAEANIDTVKADVDQRRVPRCEACGGLVKPDIVFFGEGLPQRFVDLHRADMEAADAVVVLGTSLQVQPFSNLPNMVAHTVPRLLINREAVGPFQCPCANPAVAEALKAEALKSEDPRPPTRSASTPEPSPSPAATPDPMPAPASQRLCVQATDRGSATAAGGPPPRDPVGGQRRPAASKRRFPAAVDPRLPGSGPEPTAPGSEDRAKPLLRRSQSTRSPKTKTASETKTASGQGDARALPSWRSERSLQGAGAPALSDRVWGGPAALREQGASFKGLRRPAGAQRLAQAMSWGSLGGG